MLSYTFSSGWKIKSYGLLGLLVWKSARQALSYNYTVLSVCGLSRCLTNLLNKPPWFTQTAFKWLTIIYRPGTDKCYSNNERTHLNNELGFGRSTERWLMVHGSPCHSSKTRAEEQQERVPWATSSFSASFAHCWIQEVLEQEVAHPISTGKSVSYSLNLVKSKAEQGIKRNPPTRSCISSPLNNNNSGPKWQQSRLFSFPTCKSSSWVFLSRKQEVSISSHEIRNWILERTL